MDKSDKLISMMIGEKIGFLFSYFLFTTILYYILLFLNKLPETWAYYHIAGITLAIVLSGALINRLIR